VFDPISLCFTRFFFTLGRGLSFSPDRFQSPDSVFSLTCQVHSPGARRAGPLLVFEIAAFFSQRNPPPRVVYSCFFPLRIRVEEASVPSSPHDTQGVSWPDIADLFSVAAWFFPLETPLRPYFFFSLVLTVTLSVFSILSCLPLAGWAPPSYIGGPPASLSLFIHGLPLPLTRLVRQMSWKECSLVLQQYALVP